MQEEESPSKEIEKKPDIVDLKVCPVDERISLNPKIKQEPDVID